jgi:glycosyltransferase involved in cell wall biosynthesis
MSFSAVIVARDEEPMIEGALQLLGFCQEIVVIVDDMTIDGTEEIARRYTEHVHRVRFTGFGELKNEGVRRARGEWIVFCDADERVTPRLAAQLQEAVSQGTELWAFRTPTVNFFWGRRMRYGGWRETHVKLVRREHALHSGEVHEQLHLPADRIGWLDGERWHFSHRSIEEGLRKTIEYGRIDSAARQAAGAARVNPLTFLRVMLHDFLWRGIRRAGWRDGMPGMIEVVFQPFALFCAAVMLWERQHSDQIRARYQELERLVKQDP